MADMSASGLSIKSVEFILNTSLRRAPISSSLRTPHRDTGLRIISSSLDPRSMAERHPPPPLLSAPLSPAQPVPGPILGWGLFFSSPRHGHATCRQPVAFAYLLDRLSLCLTHSSHDVSGIADQTVKTYIATVAGEAAPYPPPSDPLLATPDRSRILLPRRRSTGLAHILLPCAGPKLAIWLRPYHQAPTSVGASFFVLGDWPTWSPHKHARQGPPRRRAITRPGSQTLSESAWQHFQLRVCVAASGDG